MLIWAMCFFDNIILFSMRYAKLIDEHHSNRNYHYYIVFKKEHIKFYSTDRKNPDCLVKMVHVLMIVPALEVDQGL